VPHTDQPLTWLTGMRTMTTAGDVNTQVGMASHIYLVTASMEDEYFYSADSELLVVPQEGRCASAPSSASSTWSRKEIAIMPRGLVYRVELLTARRAASSARTTARNSSCRARPDRRQLHGQPRDFKTPVAAFEDREVPSTVTVKWCGQFHETEIGHSPARRGRLARQLRAGEIRPDAPIARSARSCSIIRTRRSSPC
jgi:homogentisate 1,2-dioxygenase